MQAVIFDSANNQWMSLSKRTRAQVSVLGNWWDGHGKKRNWEDWTNTRVGNRTGNRAPMFPI